MIEEVEDILTRLFFFLPSDSSISPHQYSSEMRKKSEVVSLSSS
jgi:hypothetical protein